METIKHIIEIIKGIFGGRTKRIIDHYQEVMDEQSKRYNTMLNDMSKSQERAFTEIETLNEKVTSVSKDVHSLTLLCTQILGLANRAVALKCTKVDCPNRCPKLNLDDRYAIHEGKLVDLRPETDESKANSK